ncbi:MAG: glycosyltransferase family 2 protein [Pseudomonadota bacterium]
MSATQPKPVSVVVVAYASGPILADSLRRLAADPAVGQIVLVDNGDSPASRVAADLPLPADVSVEVLRGHGNVGFAAGCNLGATRATGEFVLFSNPDCLWPAGALTRLLAALDPLPLNSLVSPLLVNLDRSEQRGARRAVPTPWRSLVEWLGLYRIAPRHPYFRQFRRACQQRVNRLQEPVPTQTVPVEVTSGAAMLLRRELFAALGGFDERYFLHVEDIDLCVTLLQRGGHPYLAPAARVTHVGGSSRVHPLRVEWHKARGFAYYFGKHFAGLYPPGVVGLVRVLVWIRFAARLPSLALFSAPPDRTESPLGVMP